VPVDDALVMLHLKNDKPNSINGQIAIIKDLQTTPIISAEQAHQIAKEYSKTIELLNIYPIKLLIAQIPAENGIKHLLVYKVRIDASYSKMENVFVDAQTGKVINTISLINDADITATANTLYSGTQTITTDSYAGGFRLVNNAKKIVTFDMKNGTDYSKAEHFTNSTTNWNIQEVTLDSIKIIAVNDSWKDSLGDKISNGGLPDIYIVIKNANNDTLWSFSNKYFKDMLPPILISTKKICLNNNGSYTLDVYDYDGNNGSTLLGTFSFTATNGFCFF
jgi:Zn-dependent metalloprotease